MIPISLIHFGEKGNNQGNKMTHVSLLTDVSENF